NGHRGTKHRFVRSDTFEFLERSRESYDLCVVDPPTRSVNRSSGRVFDVQADHVRLLRLVLDRMRPGGTVSFSTNFRTFQLDEKGFGEGRSRGVSSIMKKRIPPAFERNLSLLCCLLQVGAK